MLETFTYTLLQQLHHINQRDDPYCEICKTQLGEEIQEDYKHALYSCPNTQRIIKHITNKLFPTTTNKCFSIADILLTNKTNISKDYESIGAREFINLVWDNFQIQITVCHTAGKIPNQNLVLKAILKTTKEIIKTFPKSSINNFINETQHIKELLQ